MRRLRARIFPGRANLPSAPAGVGATAGSRGVDFAGALLFLVLDSPKTRVGLDRPKKTRVGLSFGFRLRFFGATPGFKLFAVALLMSVNTSSVIVL